MSDEKIVIEIGDKVSDAVPSKIEKIAREARAGYNAIERLTKALADIKSNPVDQLATSNNKLQTALDKTALAAARLQTEQQRTINTANQAAVSQQKLATEIQKTNAAWSASEAALNRAVSAEAKAATESQKLASAQAKTATEVQKLANEQQKANVAFLQTEAALSKAVAAETRATAATEQLRAAQTRSATEAQKLSAAQQGAQTAMTQAQVAATKLQAAQTASANAATLASQKLASEQQRTAAAANLNSIAQQKVATAFIQGANAQQQYVNSTVRVQVTQNQAATAAQKLATEQQRTAVQTANAAAAADRAAMAALRLQNAQTSQGRATSATAEALLRYARNAAIVAGIGFGAHQILEAADAYAVLQNRLRIVSDTEEQLNELTARLLDLSNKTFTPVEASAQSFARLDNSLINLGKSQAETLRLQETLNKLFIVGGSTTSEQTFALVQLTQAFNAGKLQGDEFRSLMENMPRQVRTAIAATLGVNESNLKSLSSQGKITADVLFRAFSSLEGFADSKFAKIVPTLGQSLVVLKNNATFAFGEFLKATGITAALSGAILALAHNLDIVTIALVAVGTATAVAFGPQIVAGIARMITGVRALTLAIAANPIGLIVVAVTTAIVALVEFSDRISTSADGVVKLRDTAQATFEVIGKYANALADTIKATYAAIVGSIESIFSKLPKFFGPALEFINKAASALNPFSLGINVLKAVFNSTADEIQKRAREIARNRNFVPGSHQVTPPGGNLRGSGVDTTGGQDDVKRVEALRRINDALDAQTARLFQLKPQRDIQAQLDNVELDLAKKKITLSESERNAIRDKITALQEATVVQQKYDEIYEESISPIRDFNATVDAASKLLRQGSVSTAEYDKAVTKATETYLNIIDPLRQYNRELDDQERLLKLLPREREVEQKLTELSNALLAEGRHLTQDQTKAMRERLKVQRDLNEAAQAEAQIYQQTVGARKSFNDQLKAADRLARGGKISQGDKAEAVVDLAKNAGIDLEGTELATKAQLNTFKTMYEQINELRQLDLINEREASALRLRLQTEAFDAQTKNAQKALGGLAQLSNLGNEKLFKVGKAAAIANAGIQGATAVMNALATPPWYVGIALAIGAAAQVAAQIANIKAMKYSPGYMAGGFTGNSARDQVAGVVHGQEFVMNAQATNRIGVEGLNALQSGAAQVKMNGAESAGKGVSVKIENYGTSKSFEVQSLDEGQVRIIARDEAKQQVGNLAPKVIANELGNPNSTVSRSMSKNVNASRKR